MNSVTKIYVEEDALLVTDELGNEVHPVYLATKNALANGTKLLIVTVGNRMPFKYLTQSRKAIEDANLFLHPVINGSRDEAEAIMTEIITSSNIKNEVVEMMQRIALDPDAEDSARAWESFGEVLTDADSKLIVLFNHYNR